MSRRKRSTGTLTYVVPTYLVVTVDADDVAELGSEPDPGTIGPYFETQWDGDPVEFATVDGDDISGTVVVIPTDAHQVTISGPITTDAVRAALKAAGVAV